MHSTSVRTPYLRLHQAPVVEDAITCEEVNCNHGEANHGQATMPDLGMSTESHKGVFLVHNY